MVSPALALWLLMASHAWCNEAGPPCSTGDHGWFDVVSQEEWLLEHVDEITVPLKNGRKVTCIVYHYYNGQAGGISCDWGSKKRKPSRKPRTRLGTPPTEE